jgi:hypothetical protein
MLLVTGDYRYAIRLRGEVTAFEEARVGPSTISATRREVDGLIIRHAEAMLDTTGKIDRISLRYVSSLFQRDASYRVDGESFRGSVSAMAGRNEIVVKLGRFGEVEAADLTIFRALLLAHVRERGAPRWTGRVAVIDRNTLAAASLKQTCRAGPLPATWIYEARMGDTEEIGLDDTVRDGTTRIVRRRDSRGNEIALVAFVSS